MPPEQVAISERGAVAGVTPGQQLSASSLSSAAVQKEVALKMIPKKRALEIPRGHLRGAWPRSHASRWFNSS